MLHYVLSQHETDLSFSHYNSTLTREMSADADLPSLDPDLGCWWYRVGAERKPTSRLPLLAFAIAQTSYRPAMHKCRMFHKVFVLSRRRPVRSRQSFPTSQDPRREQSFSYRARHADRTPHLRVLPRSDTPDAPHALTSIPIIKSNDDHQVDARDIPRTRLQFSDNNTDPQIPPCLPSRMVQKGCRSHNLRPLMSTQRYSSSTTQIESALRRSFYEKSIFA